MGKLRIDLLGTSFSIQAANGNEEYLQKLLGYYKRIADDVEASGVKNPIQIAILAGMNICDELYKEKENKIANENSLFSQSDNIKSNEITLEKEEIERRTQEMINKINKVL